MSVEGQLIELRYALNKRLMIPDVYDSFSRLKASVESGLYFFLNIFHSKQDLLQLFNALMVFRLMNSSSLSV